MTDLGLTPPLLISLLALMIAALQALAGWRQVKVSVSQVQFTQMQAFHAEKIENLEIECEGLRADVRRAQQHADLCEAELARIKHVLQGRRDYPHDLA